MSKAVSKSIDWEKVGKLVLQWAQDDGTNDELMDLVGPLEDEGVFWDQFASRVNKAFGRRPGRAFLFDEDGSYGPIEVPRPYPPHLEHEGRQYRLEKGLIGMPRVSGRFARYVKA